MLVVRKEQIEALEQAALKNFENQMVAHIKEFFPKNYEIIGIPQIRKVIQYGLERAENYDLTTEREICLYLSLMLKLGSNFDVDLQLPWAAETLNDETIADPFIRVNTLHDKSEVYFSQAVGEDHQHLENALVKIIEKSDRLFSLPLKNNFEDHMLTELWKLFPEKFKVLGKPVLHDLIEQGLGSAKKYNITNERGLMIYIGLMFMLGSGFDTDPQLPWAIEILNDNSIKDQATRVELLYNTAISTLKKWLD